MKISKQARRDAKQLFNICKVAGVLDEARVRQTVGAVIAQTRSRGALFAGVSLPILFPVLALGVAGTRAQWEGMSVLEFVRPLAAYAVALLGMSLLLYDHLWED